MITIHKTITVPSTTSVEGIYLVKGITPDVTGIYAVTNGEVFRLSGDSIATVHTYSELKAKALANDLVAGSTYIMSDFQHSQYNKYYAGDAVETLVFKAKYDGTLDLDNVINLSYPKAVCSYTFASECEGLDDWSYAFNKKYSPVSGALKGVIYNIRFGTTMHCADFMKLRVANDSKLIANYSYPNPNDVVGLNNVTIGKITLAKNSHIQDMPANYGATNGGRIIIGGYINLSEELWAKEGYIEIHSSAGVKARWIDSLGITASVTFKNITVDITEYIDGYGGSIACGSYDTDPSNIIVGDICLMSAVNSNVSIRSSIKCAGKSTFRFHNCNVTFEKPLGDKTIHFAKGTFAWENVVGTMNCAVNNMSFCKLDVSLDVGTILDGASYTYKNLAGNSISVPTYYAFTFHNFTQCSRQTPLNVVPDVPLPTIKTLDNTKLPSTLSSASFSNFNQEASMFIASDYSDWDITAISQILSRDGGITIQELNPFYTN